MVALDEIPEEICIQNRLNDFSHERNHHNMVLIVNPFLNKNLPVNYIKYPIKSQQKNHVRSDVLNILELGDHVKLG